MIRAFGMNQKFALVFSLVFFAGFSVSADEAPVTPKPKYGPTSQPYATTLAASHGYFQSPKHPSPVFWSLIGYYVPQYSGSACSAASITMALNAARAGLSKTADDKLILQPDLVEKITAGHWKERLSADGFGEKKIHGTPLKVLREVAEAAFKANGFPDVAVDAIHVRDVSAKTLSVIHKILLDNEKSANAFILANFNQQAFTDDADAGHIAPVGAYDAEKKRVLILDPDREWYEPYWVSEQRFIEGMYTKDKDGDDYRGLIVIRLLSKQ